MKGTTSSNVSALRASLSPVNRIAQAKKPFIIGELIPPAAKDICPELLGDAAAQKVASSVTRRADETAEGAGAGLQGGLRNPCGMQSRLTSLLTWATDSSACFCVICSPGGCASRHVTRTFVASQHHSH